MRLRRMELPRAIDEAQASFFGKPYIQDNSDTA
jgi:hypothetical protein